MENQNGPNGFLARLVPSTDSNGSGLIAWTQVIDIVVGLLVVLPGIADTEGFFGTFLAFASILVGMLSLALLAR